MFISRVNTDLCKLRIYHAFIKYDLDLLMFKLPIMTVPATINDSKFLHEIHQSKFTAHTTVS